MPMWLHNTLQKIVKELLKADSASSIRRSHLVSMAFFDLLSCGFGDFVCGPKTKNYDLVILMF